MEEGEDFNPPEKPIYKKCVCGYPCPDEDTYNQHTKNCTVFAAEQISGYSPRKTKEEIKTEAKEQIDGNSQEETKVEKKEEAEKETPSDLINNATEPLISDFNLDNLRLDGAPVSSVQLYTVVPVRKPNKQEFFRTREGWHFSTKTLMTKEGFTEIRYMVDNSLWEQLGSELQGVDYFAAINTEGVVFLIPVTISEGGRGYRWINSLLNVINIAKTDWVRIRSNLDVGAYEAVIALENLGEPKWPETVVNRGKETVEFSMNLILQTAFFERYISNVDHPVIKKLLGQTL